MLSLFIWISIKIDSLHKQAKLEQDQPSICRLASNLRRVQTSGDYVDSALKTPDRKRNKRVNIVISCKHFRQEHAQLRLVFSHG